MQQDGIIKFKQFHSSKDIAQFLQTYLQELNYVRDTIHSYNLIGIDKNKIGYGNLSTRFKDSQFFITGTQTGGKASLTNTDYALVTKVNLERNQLWSIGTISASSESLTHAAIYIHNPKIKAIIHIHHKTIWEYEVQQKRYPITPENAEYGTSLIAQTAGQLAETSPEGIIILGGHPEGIIYFSTTLKSTKQKCLQHYHAVVEGS